MDATDYPNLEKLLNIIANGMEILMIGFGGPLLFLWWIPQMGGSKGYGLKIFLLGIVMIVLALASPAAIGALMERGDSGMLFALIGAGAMLLVSMVLMAIVYFLPSYFALGVHKKKNKWVILALNIGFGFVPFSWIALFIWACRPDE